jgi:DNA-binding transcriptional regulator YhcF (GntR family)
MAIWIWRKELKINQFGFIGGNDIEPTDPETFPKQPSPDTPAIDKQEGSDKEIDKTTDFETFKAQELKKNIIDYFKQRPYGLTNANILASKFGVSTHTIQRFLFELMKENFVRRDTYPGSGKANFSYSASIENIAIDDFAKHLKTEILSDNRFVRVSQRYEVDAIIQTSIMNYVIEVKNMENIITKHVDDAVKQLMAVEEHIKLSPLKLVLIIASKKKFEMRLLEEYQNIENLTIYFFDYEG